MRHAYAHRVAYALHHGLPAKFEGTVCHHCDNPRCINPAHLFLGTQADNIRDKVAKGRHPRGEANYAAKLTEADIRAIRADGRKNTLIGPEYGVTCMTVGKIKRRERWAHVA